MVNRAAVVVLWGLRTESILGCPAEGKLTAFSLHLGAPHFKSPMHHIWVYLWVMLKD